MVDKYIRRVAELIYETCGLGNGIVLVQAFIHEACNHRCTNLQRFFERVRFELAVIGDKSR